MERRKFLKSAAVTGVGATAATIAAPAISQGKKEMVIVSSWPRDFPGLGLSAQRLAKRITELSEGRITTKYFSAGERVGAFDVFDEVASGNAQAYISADYYFKGKHPGFAFFTAVPFGMTNLEWNAWIKFGGGQALWDELHGGYGMKAITCGGTGTQMGGWFNKEINTADDLKGLKMRIPGLGGDVLAKLGGSPVSLPGGQIYENLVSGAISATEWVGPYNDYFMKFYEAAKFYYYPGFHEPGGGLAFAMNNKWWSGLSKWEQALLTAACNEENALHYEEAQANNGKYLAKLINEHGVVTKQFSDEIYDSFAKGWEEVLEETRSHS
ncbi:MAG: TRAP transporter substrate-binding protein, partial [Burkholderiaceae bacterium]